CGRVHHSYRAHYARQEGFPEELESDRLRTSAQGLGIFPQLNSLPNNSVQVPLGLEALTEKKRSYRSVENAAPPGSGSVRLTRYRLFVLFSIATCSWRSGRSQSAVRQRAC